MTNGDEVLSLRRDGATVVRVLRVRRELPKIDAADAVHEDNREQLQTLGHAAIIAWRRVYELPMRCRDLVLLEVPAACWIRHSMLDALADEPDADLDRRALFGLSAFVAMKGCRPAVWFWFSLPMRAADPPLLVTTVRVESMWDAFRRFHGLSWEQYNASARSVRLDG